VALARRRPTTVAIVLAGGRGERFWPRSRADLPKPFLPLLGERSLLQEAYARACMVADGGAVFVVTARAFAPRVRRHLPDLGPDRLVVEPVGRDTAPALALAMAMVRKRVGEAVAVALPADHWVDDAGAFAAACRRAAAVAARTGGPVLLGVRPTRPETAYGYILPARAAGRAGWAPVAAFREKPPAAEALRLMRAGALWNAGVFAWRPEAYLDAVRRRLPAVARAAEALAADGGGRGASARAFAALKPVSVDHGLLEGAEGTCVVPGRFAWDDVGGWGALARLGEADAQANVVRGRALALECENVMLDSGAGRLVVAFGLRDAVVVDSADVVLVLARERAGDLKQVTAALRERGLGTYLARAGAAHTPAGARVVPKPWGREVWWAQTDRYLAKLLEVEPGQALSLQYHREKRETMLVLSGGGSLTLADGAPVPVGPGSRVDVPPGTVHRLEAGADGLTVVEVSTPETDDVVRLEDRYRRRSGDERAPQKGTRRSS
jgi:mannose-1-phosphate guanylyltransferase/mannose-6-phosphate isomerase